MIGIVDNLTAPSQGALRQSDGGTTWRVWAPQHERVTLVLSEEGEQRSTREMHRTDDGYFIWNEADVRPGQRYAYRLGNSGRDLPDPASRWQPQGVHKPSAVFVAEEFPWSDAGWRGIEPARLAICELHVGTFTPAGTFDAVAARLPELRELGITAIELMPVAQFSGTRNWGYDGVHPFAAQESYGGPHGLQRLVDVAHRAGMAVLLDVVYNHLGPEGNYFAEFGPYFTDRYHTPWGKALNYDGPDSDAVRKLVIDNATMWVRDFHLDGLRLDAVQTIYDTSALHILAELQQAVQRIAAEQERQVVVIAETDQNDVRLVTPQQLGGYGLDGVWSDDFHHSVHALLTGERDGYYVDFGQPEQLAKALRDVFVYDGRYSPFRRRRHGNRVGDVPRDRFVCCIQNHDQIGNRIMGDRLAATLSPAQQRLAAALLLLSPTVPLLFMGQEYGETNPFPFFCSFSDPGLIDAVRRGRRAEMASVRFRWHGEPMDPQSPATFATAKLSWSWTKDEHRSALRALYRDLLQARQAWPALVERTIEKVAIVGNHAAPCLTFDVGRSERLRVWANLSQAPVPAPELPPSDTVTLLSTESRAYGGQRGPVDAVVELGPFECVVWGKASNRPDA